MKTQLKSSFKLLLGSIILLIANQALVAEDQLFVPKNLPPAVPKGYQAQLESTNFESNQPAQQVIVDQVLLEPIKTSPTLDSLSIKGNADTVYQIAQQFWESKDIKRNDQLALFFFSQADQLGHKDAKAMMGLVYAQSKDPDVRNLKESLLHLTQSALKGSDIGKVNLAKFITILNQNKSVLTDAKRINQELNTPLPPIVYRDTKTTSAIKDSQTANTNLAAQLQQDHATEASFSLFNSSGNSNESNNPNFYQDNVDIIDIAPQLNSGNSQNQEENTSSKKPDDPQIFIQKDLNKSFNE